MASPSSLMLYFSLSCFLYEAENLLQGVMRIRYSKIWNRQYGEIQLYKFSEWSI